MNENSTERQAEPKRCIECAEEIDKGALKCRHCGAYQHKSKRWMGPLVTILSLLVAVLSLAISSLDKVYDLAFPKSPLFAALEESENSTMHLTVHNESPDSVVIEDMKCFLKFTIDESDHRYMDSFWAETDSSIIPPDGVFESQVEWMGSTVVDDELDSYVGAPLPKAEIQVRRWHSGGCACDGSNEPHDPNEKITIPISACRIYFRSSRLKLSYYDFSAQALDNFLGGMRDHSGDQVLEPDQRSGPI